MRRGPTHANSASTALLILLAEFVGELVESFRWAQDEYANGGEAWNTQRFADPKWLSSSIVVA